MITPHENNQENNSQEALTSIHKIYTLSATDGDVERIMIKHFNETLAEVALAVASRKIEENEE